MNSLSASLRNLLIKSLGLEQYLLLISSIYLRLFRHDLLGKKHSDKYFIRKILKKGDHVIDIGANLGYYTVPASQLVGKNGQVYAVEPVPLFVKMLKANMLQSRYHRNITIYECALGEEEGAVLEMGTPEVGGIFRHGLTRVINRNDQQTYSKTYTVPMRNPVKLFSHLHRLDYIKCDVEGFEMQVIPHFRDIIERFKPLVQIEIGKTEDRVALGKMLSEIGYSVYSLTSDLRLKRFALEDVGSIGGDLYFVPDARRNQYPIV